MGDYNESLKCYVRNMKAMIAKAKRDGIVGMSRANLRQIVSTKGLTIPPAAFDRLVDDAIRIVKVKGFAIYA